MPRAVYLRKPKPVMDEGEILAKKEEAFARKIAERAMNGHTKTHRTKSVKIMRLKVTDSVRLRMLIGSMSDEEFKRIFGRPKHLSDLTPKMCRELMNTAIEKALLRV